jgi:hypothetical protein
VGIVLGDVAHPQQAVQSARRLVAVDEPGLRVTDRQVAIGAPLVLVDLDVRRAVHGLEAHRPLLDLREVHVVAVHVPVAGLLPQVDVVEDRRLDLVVAAGGVLLAPHALDLVPDGHAGRLPERAPGRDLVEQEEPELLAELAVVAGARLLETLEVVVEVLLLEEGRPVDAGEHLAARVAAPVRAGDRLQLEGADALGRRRVRAAAQVGEGAVGVERDGPHAVVAHEVLDELDLVVLALGAEALERLGHGDVLAREGLVGGDVLAHARLDGLEVGVRDGDAVGELEVVVEAVLDRRPDRDLHARIELEDGRGQDVRGVVADEVQGLLPAALGHDLQRLAGLQRRREVADAAVLLDGQRGARQPRADLGGSVGARGAFGQLERVAVGEGDLHL